MESKRKHKSYDFEFKLTVINWAKEAGNRAAARKYSVDEKRVRDWRKQESTLVECMKEARQKRKRIPGAGRKHISDILDTAVFDWIVEQRKKSLKVSRRSIQEKARELLVTLENSSCDNFKASNGWLQKFMIRHHLHRKTTLDNKDPDDLNKKIASYITYMSNIPESKKIARDDSTNTMDESSVCFNTPDALSICPEETEDFIHYIKPEATREKATDILDMARRQGQTEELTIEVDIDEADANVVLIDSDVDDATASTDENEETVNYNEKSSEEVI